MPQTSPQVVQLWAANVLHAAAGWREEKAVDFPDDLRNARSAAALRAAATYTRNVGTSVGIEQLADLVEAAHVSGVELVPLTNGSVIPSDLPGPESNRIAARYFFDNSPLQADRESHEQLLSDLAKAILVDTQEWDIPPHSRLARLHKRVLTPKDPVAELLTEIRDLLRDRLPAGEGGES